MFGFLVDVSVVWVGAVFYDVCELFVERVCFLFVGYGCVVVESDGGVRCVFGFLVVESRNCFPEFVCICSVIPVVFKVLFPDKCFVFLYEFVYVCVEVWDAWVFVVLLSDGVALFYEFAYVLWE